MPVSLWLTINKHCSAKKLSLLCIVILNSESVGLKESIDSQPVVVEFSSPNINKPLHLGHIRNHLIGDSVCRILSAGGENVIKVNLVNDRGIHICKSMLAWKLFGNGATPGSTGQKGDKLVGDYYVLFDKKYKEELAELKASGMDEDDFVLVTQKSDFDFFKSRLQHQRHKNHLDA